MTREEKEKMIQDRIQDIGNMSDTMVDILYTLLQE